MHPAVVLDCAVCLLDVQATARSCLDRKLPCRANGIVGFAIPDGTDDLVEQGRNAAYGAVNAVMIETYWRIGQRIVEQEQKGKARADYGKHVIQLASEALTEKFGKGYSESQMATSKNCFG